MLSSGALVTLRTALATPALENIALYEPPFSISGSIPTAWVPRYKRELSAGKVASALVTGMKGLAVVHIFTVIPRFILQPGLSLVMALQGETTLDDVTIRSLVPTWQYDMQAITEMSDTLDTYKTAEANVLLMGGTKSPSYLNASLDALHEVLPHVKRVTFLGLAHDGLEDDGNPTLVAEDLRKFFTT